MLAYSFFDCFFVLLSKGLYVSPGCSETHYIDQAGLKHKERLLASKSWGFFLNNALDTHMNFRIHWRLFFRFWCGLHSRCSLLLLIESFPNIKYAKWGIKKVCLLVSLISFFSVNEVFIVELFHLLNYNMYS